MTFQAIEFIACTAWIISVLII